MRETLMAILFVIIIVCLFFGIEVIESRRNALDLRKSIISHQLDYIEEQERISRAFRNQIHEISEELDKRKKVKNSGEDEAR